MKTKNNFVNLLFSTAIVLLAAYILSIGYFRLDLTAEGRYTLSDYTTNILKSLDDDIYVKVYLTGDDLPINLKKFSKAINEELDEFEVYAGGRLDYTFINPTESDDKNVRFGIYKMLMDNGLVPIEINENTNGANISQKLVFPSLIISYKGRSLGLNLLKNYGNIPPESEQSINNSIESLEYELTNALQKLSTNEKPQIAFLEGQKELSEYQVMDISSVLSEYYEVKRGRIGGNIGILDSFKTVIIAKPLGQFSEVDKYVIDQYIMKGGNVLWMLEGTETNLDSLFVTASTISMGLDNNLSDMLFNYGVRINNNLLQDKYASPIGIVKKIDGEKPKIDLYPWNYFPVIVSDNKHLISKYLNYVKTEFVSTIDTVGTDYSIKKSVLLHSSPYTFEESVPIRISLDLINTMYEDPRLTNGEKALSVLLEGEFKSAFANRNIKQFMNKSSDYKHINKGKLAKMIFVSDADIIKNEVTSEGRPYPVGYDKFSQRTYEGNKEFILNAVNYLSDDGGLMTIRSRELKMRLLDAEKVKKHRFVLQLINVLLPSLIVILFGIAVYFFRKRKYTR